MEYRNLGRTGLKVSELCLGTMQWGWTADESQSFAVMDAFVAAGGNFIDTADVYSRWAEGNPGGVSEEIIGRWMKASGNRRQIVLATKVRGVMWDGPNGEGLSRGHIMAPSRTACAACRPTSSTCTRPTGSTPSTPIDETMRGAGRPGAPGQGAHRGLLQLPGLAAGQGAVDQRQARPGPLRQLQPHYNIAYRAEFERELKPLCEAEGIGVIPYSPLAGGFLTGKYRRDAPVPDSARASGIQRRYLNDKGFTILEALEKLGQARGKSIAQMALAWQLSQPVITSPIIGANSVEQLNDSLGAVGVRLT